MPGVIESQKITTLLRLQSQKITIIINSRPIYNIGYILKFIMSTSFERFQAKTLS